MTLKAEFTSDPRQFFETYPTILPGTQYQEGVIDPMAEEGDFYPVDGFNKGYDIPATARRVAWVPTATGEVELVLEGSPRANKLAPPDGEFFSAFFLPWQKGFIGRMDLPSAGGVSYFFTAEMNGCAFLATGSRSHPTVAHLNVEEPEVDRPMPWEQHRQRTLETMIAAALTGKNLSRADILTKWGPKIGSGANAARTLINNGRTYDRTAHEEGAATVQFVGDLLAENRKLDPAFAHQPVVDIRCSTIGIREGDGYWHFYYQRTLYVLATHTIEKLNSQWKGFKKKVFGDHRPRLVRDHRYIIDGSEFLPLWP